MQYVIGRSQPSVANDCKVKCEATDDSDNKCPAEGQLLNMID